MNSKLTPFTPTLPSSKPASGVEELGLPQVPGPHSHFLGGSWKPDTNKGRRYHLAGCRYHHISSGLGSCSQRGKVQLEKQGDKAVSFSVTQRRDWISSRRPCPSQDPHTQEPLKMWVWPKRQRAMSPGCQQGSLGLRTRYGVQGSRAEKVKKAPPTPKSHSLGYIFPIPESTKPHGPGRPLD